MATVLYKTKDMGLPTVVFDGDTFYEFLCRGPGLFEFETTDPKVVDFLTGMGYKTKSKSSRERIPKQEDPKKEPKAAPPPPPGN